MLRRLFGAARAARPYGSVPPGRRVYAVGDVHGRLDLLDRLLDMVAADAGDAAYELILLGDLVDRGPNSADVVERVRVMAAAAEPPVTVLAGNHEEIMLGAIAGEAEMIRLFCRAGGRETALSYGLGPAAYDGMGFDELAAWLASNVPPAHRDFLTGLSDREVRGDYAFVHAGVRPGVPLAEQAVSDLRWIRNSFLNHAEPFEKTVVHGHSISEEVNYRPNRIGIDTGAFRSGKLTALGLEDDRYWLVQT